MQLSLANTPLPFIHADPNDFIVQDQVHEFYLVHCFCSRKTSNMQCQTIALKYKTSLHIVYMHMWANEPQSTSQIIHLSVHLMLCVTAVAVSQEKRGMEAWSGVSIHELPKQ